MDRSVGQNDEGLPPPSPLPAARSGGGHRSRSRVKVEHSAGGVVLREVEGAWHLLLIKDPYGNWGLPKGHVEEGEKAGEAALREVREETGLSDLTMVSEVGTIDWFFKLRGKLIHKYCVFFAMHSAEGEAVPEAEEGITDCVWVPLSEAASRISYNNARGIVQEVAKRSEGGELPIQF